MIPAHAAAFFPGILSTSQGHAAIPSLTMKKTKPPTIAMCRPEIDRMWASPESRIACSSAGSIQAS